MVIEKSYDGVIHGGFSITIIYEPSHLVTIKQP